MTCAFSLISVPYSLQIKVRDLSRASVSISPAEFGTWSQARSELLLEAKRPLKAQLQAELAAAADETAAEEIRAAFQAREKALEHDIDHKPMEVHLEMGICAPLQFNFPANPPTRLFSSYAPLLCHSVQFSQ